MEYTIRPMLIEDIPQIIVIEKKSFPPHGLHMRLIVNSVIMSLPTILF